MKDYYNAANNAEGKLLELVSYVLDSDSNCLPKKKLIISDCLKNKGKKTPNYLF